MLGFILAVQEAHAALLLAAPGQELISIRAYTLLHFAPDTVVAAFCTTSSLFIVLCAGTISGLFSLTRRVIMKLVPELHLD